MAVIAVVLAAALIAGAIAGIVAWRLPNLDPTAPRAPSAIVAREIDAHPKFRRFMRARVDPAIATGLALTVALTLVVGGVVAIGLLLVMIQHNAGLARWDLSAARWGASHATPSSTRFLKDVSLLGGTLMIVAAAVAAAAVEYARTRRAAIFAFLLLVVGGQFAVANLTKVLVDRDRPDIRRLTGFSGASFPSGHATAAAATFAAIALLLGRRRSQTTKAVLAGAAAAIAVAVATTRVLLGVHWLTDVVAGLALGWAWFAAWSIAFGGRVLDFGHPVEVAEASVATDHPIGAMPRDAPAGYVDEPVSDRGRAYAHAHETRQHERRTAT
jgi:membrane-associated phospholipid phosphatase